MTHRGAPTSLKNSSEQWDYPNTWPPLQHMLIMGLYDSRHLDPQAETMAHDFAKKWIRTNYVGYKKTGAMYEKVGANVLYYKSHK